MSQPVRSIWDNVDRTADPGWYRRYLDTFNALEAVQAYKEHSFALLDIQLGHRVLDVGCGTGRDVLTLAERVGPAGQAIGIDTSAHLIAEAQERASEGDLPVTYAVGDVYALGFDDASIDGCRADRVFQHLDRPREALQEVVRVVRPGGRIVVDDPDWETLIIDAPHAGLTRTILNFVCDSHRNAWMGRQLYGHFRALGLEEIAVVADTLVFTEYALAEQTVTLEQRVRQAKDAGIVDEAPAAAWLEALAEAGRSGRFFAAMTFFNVGGRKPR